MHRVSVAKAPHLSAAAFMFFGFFTPACMVLYLFGTTTPIWLSNAIAVAVLLYNPLSTWPALLLVEAIADFSASMLSGSGITISSGGVVCDAIEVLLVAVFLLHIRRTQPLFSNLRQISRFAGICAVVPLVSATAGTSLLVETQSVPFPQTWVNWYLSSVFGLLIMAPFLLMWTDEVQSVNISQRRKIEVVLLALLVGVVGGVDFGVAALPGLFLCFPFLLLAAFRGGLLGATTAAVALTLVASGFTLLSLGPLAQVSNTHILGPILLLQLYLGTVLISTLPVAVMLEQRKLLNAAETVSQLSRMARHDVLTGLPNRLLFEERFGQMQIECSNRNIVVLLFDLDRFKPVNDLHGHAAGDQLLRLAAKRLCANARDTDTVARLGGDEFAIVGCIEDQIVAQQMAERIITALGRPFELAHCTVQVGCSAGLALGPSESFDVEQLVQRADAALYRAKAEGRNRIRLFEPGMDDAVRQRAELEAELRHAVIYDHLVPYYQPIVKIGSGEIIGFEMLARWTHVTLGNIAPTIFIPLAETIGVIGVISERLLRLACQTAMTWPNHLFVTVNVSPLQLYDRALPDLVRTILNSTGLPAERLEIELTESALIGDFDLARQVLIDLKAMGIKLTLDDFGTGYSSLRHLQELPFDKIKVDTEFVRSMTNVAASRKIVAGVIGLGHSLGLPVVAEGIEDLEAAEALELMGCEMGQGWLYGHPMPVDEVAVILQHAKADAGSAVANIWKLA